MTGSPIVKYDGVVKRFGALTVLFISASGLTLEEVAIWAATYGLVGMAPEDGSGRTRVRVINMLREAAPPEFHRESARTVVASATNNPATATPTSRELTVRTAERERKG